jgi:hypothetical protein
VRILRSRRMRVQLGLVRERQEVDQLGHRAISTHVGTVHRKCITLATKGPADRLDQSQFQRCLSTWVRAKPGSDRDSAFDSLHLRSPEPLLKTYVLDDGFRRV